MIPADADEALEARGWDRFLDQYVSTPVQTVVFDALKPEERRDPKPLADARRTLDTAYDVLEGHPRRAGLRRRVRFSRSPTAPLRRRCSTPGSRTRRTTARTEPHALLPRPRPPPVLRRVIDEARRSRNRLLRCCRRQRIPTAATRRTPAKEHNPTAERVFETIQRAVGPALVGLLRRTRGDPGQNVAQPASPGGTDPARQSLARSTTVSKPHRSAGIAKSSTTIT